MGLNVIMKIKIYYVIDIIFDNSEYNKSKFLKDIK